jgi:hypothetical protein
MGKLLFLFEKKNKNKYEIPAGITILSRPIYLYTTKTIWFLGSSNLFSFFLLNYFVSFKTFLNPPPSSTIWSSDSRTYFWKRKNNKIAVNSGLCVAGWLVNCWQEPIEFTGNDQIEFESWTIDVACAAETCRCERLCLFGRRTPRKWRDAARPPHQFYVFRMETQHSKLLSFLLHVVITVLSTIPRLEKEKEKKKYDKQNRSAGSAWRDNLKQVTSCW